MQIDVKRFLGAFYEEAAEHLERLEAGLLELERSGGDPELLNTVFRSAHSIKGSGAVFGVTDVARFTHGLEGVLDRLREGALPVTRELVDLLLRSADLLRTLLECAQAGDPAPPETDALLAELAAYGPADGAVSAAPAPGPRPAGERLWRVRLTPAPELLAQGMDPFLLLRDLAALGELQRADADLGALPPLEELDPERCYLRWTLELRTPAAEAEIRDVFCFVDDLCEVQVEPLEDEMAAGAPEAPGGAGRRRGGAESLSLRVPTAKVDALIDLVGELIISQSMVAELLARFDESRLPLLQEAVDTMDRNVRDLQERVMSVRMLPLGDLFSRFPRMVRDLAAAREKEVALRVQGEETELDKGVIEQIADPLTHLVRNAVDHGLEPASERRAAGKPEQGVVRLTATHEAGSVVIEVADDGRGLDRGRILRKAVAQGLVPEGAEPGDAEVHALIFEPGFSTAEQVSDVSGRGVGMDVVKRNVEALNGTVAVSSTPGAGTRFRIRLPLTLAILEGMQLRVGRQVFVLPLLSIVESLRPTDAELQRVLGEGEVVRVRGEALPLLRLSRLLGVPDAVADPRHGLVVVLEHGGRRIAVLADELLGQSQVVIKNLETNYRRVDGVMGATILGDGHVALILDIAGLAELAQRPLPRAVEPALAAAGSDSPFWQEPGA